MPVMKGTWYGKRGEKKARVYLLARLGLCGRHSIKQARANGTRCSHVTCFESQTNTHAMFML